jgi:hypothetical protein
MESTSRWLADQIDDFDGNFTAQELATDAVEREELMESVEGLFGNTTTTLFTSYHFSRKLLSSYPAASDALETHRGILERYLDDCLSRRLVSEIPRMVARAIQLEPMSILPNPQADQNAYLREATRCYLYGLFNASVALSRSALEQALSSKIPTLLQRAAGGDTLSTLINTARSSILKQAPEVCNTADQVRKVANGIVHGKTCKESGAFRVLKDTRDIIVYLYRKNI